MNRKNLQAGLLFIFLLATVGAVASVDTAEYPGGGGTVDDPGFKAFSHPFPSLSRDLTRQFFVGNSFFRDAWVEAPSSTKGRDGLGPTYNAVACASCHFQDGRGAGFSAEGKIDISLLLRLSAESGEPHPVYGSQLNPFSVGGVPAEGQAEVNWQIQPGTYADGTPFELRVPSYDLSKLNLGEFHGQVSPRVAPQMAGLGLLEAIPESEILKSADPLDENADGISGRVQRVKNLRTGEMVLGRFGWKAGQPTLEQQNAAAFLGDIGITSELFPSSNCPDSQVECQRAMSGGEPELDPLILKRVTLYTSVLAVPKRRNFGEAQVVKGEEVFRSVNCQACHQPSYVTGTHEIPALVGQKIYPYTDLLLHDMGEGLADDRPEGEASGREWRTPPLWGLGVVPMVNRHTNLLHDGRARSMEEAILWHGGEAQKSRDAFLSLPKTDRDALLAFLRSL